MSTIIHIIYLSRIYVKWDSILAYIKNKNRIKPFDYFFG